jgi:hypothetical protein
MVENKRAKPGFSNFIISMLGKPVSIYPAISKNEQSESTTRWIRLSVSKFLMHLIPAR